MFWGCTFWGYQRLCMAQIGVLRAWINNVWAPAIIWHLLTHLSVFQGTNTLTPSVTHSLVVGQGIRCSSSSSSLAQRCTSKWCKWCKRWAGAMARLARLASRKWIDSSGPYGDPGPTYFLDTWDTWDTWDTLYIDIQKSVAQQWTKKCPQKENIGRASWYLDLFDLLRGN